MIFDPVNAEKAVIGCLILDPSLMEEAQSYTLDEKFFRETVHIEIWNLIEKALKDGVDFDPICLMDRGIDFETVTALTDIPDKIKSFKTYAYHLALGKHTYDLQRHIQRDPEDLQPIQDRMDKFTRMFSGQDLLTIQEIAQEAVETILDDDPRVDMPLPWERLNNRLAGCRRGKLSFVGGRPGHHKTNFIINVSVNLIKNGSKVLYADFEMGERETFERHVAVDKGLVGMEISTKRNSSGVMLSEPGRQRIAEKIGEFATECDGKLYIKSYPKLHEIKALAKSLDVDIVFIDHIQAFSNSQPMRSGETRAGHVNMICGQLKKMARELDIHVMCASQIDRNCEGPPKKNHFKESAGIEEYADVLIGVWWPCAEGNSVNSEGQLCEKDHFELQIAKNRGGPQGGMIMSVMPDTGRITQPFVPNGEI